MLAPDIVGFGDTARPDDIVYSLRTGPTTCGLPRRPRHRQDLDRRQLAGWPDRPADGHRPSRTDHQDGADGFSGCGDDLTDGLAALRAYTPSHEAMRSLLRDYFAVDPTMITDELVAIRYEASIADGAYDAYRAMFFDPRHAGSALGITEDEVRAITTPTLLVHGREDKVVPLAVSVTMLGLLPNADLHVFSRCGHWTEIERADEFSALVADYLGRP